MNKRSFTFEPASPIGSYDARCPSTACNPTPSQLHLPRCPTFILSPGRSSCLICRRALSFRDSGTIHDIEEQMRIAEEMADQQLQEANAYNLEIAAHQPAHQPEHQPEPEPEPEPAVPSFVRTASRAPQPKKKLGGASLFGVRSHWSNTAG